MPDRPPLSDEQLLALADDAEAVARFNSEERRRLGRLQATQSTFGTSSPSAIARFIEPIASAPIRGAAFLGTMIRGLDPFTTGGAEARQAAVEGVVPPMVEQLEQSREAYRQGRPAGALGHLAGGVPFIGPPVAQSLEQIQGGDVAGGLGNLAAAAVPFAAGPAMRASGRMMRATPLAEPLAKMAERAATVRMTDAIVPKVGANKVRLGNLAAEIAPQLVREPGLSAFSRTGFAEKVSVGLDEAAAGLDAAADARGLSQVKTGSILAALDRRIAELTATPVEASKTIRTAISPGLIQQPEGIFGQPRSVPNPTPVLQERPYGQRVEPDPNTTEIATLRKIRAEVEQLGPVAPYESIRRIRQAWDKTARIKYLPATAQDALASQGLATGAMKGTGAMREALAEADPASAAAYQRYHLYQAADDVVQAAEEAERVRPNRGRGIMARATGAVVGGHEAGIPGALIGAVAAGIADKAATMAPTMQIVIARRLAAVADALRRGQPRDAQALLNRTIHQFRPVRTGVRLLTKASVTAGQLAETIPRAADEDSGR